MLTRNMTDRGVAVFSGALGLLAFGFVLREGVLMTLGICGLLLVGACCVLAPRNLQALRLNLRLPSRFHAARSVSLEVDLLNRRRILDAYHVEITVRFPQSVERDGYANWTPAGGASTLRQRLSIPDRASVENVGFEICSQFPLGLFEVRRAASLVCPIQVYPRLITPLELLVVGSQPDLQPTTGTAAGDSFGEPRGIRPYQPGDAANRIHQPSTARSLARGHGLRVRAFDPPGFHPQSCRIIFHSHAQAGELILLERFERGLSLIAGTMAYFQGIFTRVSLQADFTHWRSRPCETRSQYFQCLSLLSQTKRAGRTTIHELAEILREVPKDEQIIMISDSALTNWAHVVPPSHHRVIAVDIRQIRFKKRRIQLIDP